jgi:iron uptake system component EfeO
MKSMKWSALGLIAVVLSAAGCGNGTMADEEYSKEVTQGMQASIADEIDAWHAAAQALMAAAPTPAGRGWDAKLDAEALAKLRDAWGETRVRYEHIEGAVAPLFPDIDAATDARYEDFLIELGNKSDPDPFDAEGVTGMHGIERIVFADVTPQAVRDFEKGLPGYAEAEFPKTEAQAADFKNKLCARLVQDIESLRDQWSSAQLDLPGAFDGLIALMNEQHEKVSKAATGEEESRYSQKTLADLRANLAGTRTIYALFQPWITSKEGGGAVDQNIETGFLALEKAYAAPKGDAIPAPPETWSSASPSEADLATPFGKLFVAVSDAVDPDRKGSVVDEMSNAAELLGFPQFNEGE